MEEERFGVFKYLSIGMYVKLTRYAKGERKYSSYPFLTSALYVSMWSVSRPGRFLPPGKTSSTHCTGGWVGLRAGQDTEARGKILCPFRGSDPGHVKIATSRCVTVACKCTLSDVTRVRCCCGPARGRRQSSLRISTFSP
jgi:hypothetical protein